jgi:hypothetical protein
VGSAEAGAEGAGALGSDDSGSGFAVSVGGRMSSGVELGATASCDEVELGWTASCVELG